MRWQGGRQSTNVEDRRGARGPVMVGGGIGTLVILVIVMLLGGNPQALLDQMQRQAAGPGAVQPGAAAGQNDIQKQFVAAVLAQTEDVWKEQFRAQLGKEYRVPKLVLFNGEVSSACGMADAAVGPFYCPGDNQVYLDLSFFNELETRFRAGGDFARAYVIAHEVGHHIQNQLGLSDHVQSQRGRVSQREFNDLSVRLELQADFLAGVWAHHANREYQILEPGDVQEAMIAAEAIGDDKLQMESRGYVVPDSFTHGTSAQRVRWFMKGLKTGDLDQGDTFSARQL